MNWKTITHQLWQSECGDYQISQSRASKGKLIYRASHRPTNEKLESVECFDESGDRAASLIECKQACLEHLESIIEKELMK